MIPSSHNDPPFIKKLDKLSVCQLGFPEVTQCGPDLIRPLHLKGLLWKNIFHLGDWVC